VELVRQRQVQAESGRRYKELADTYYNQGLFFINAMRDQENIDARVRVVSDKQKAIEKFRLAVENYDRALQFWTNIDPPTKDQVLVNRQDAQQYLRVLTSAQPLPLPSSPNRRQ